ncbi:AcrR family transcriptional regulator [Rhizobium petrolearium]|uniref:TetR family transcriptional regulator n=1 Tax=Neorhizobium petrolearium TaxID=515361 RepID=UPI001AE1AE94|nr:TetR family transcriptional regulator [Neorhizobium petrolearium]MBP1846448.1 AcrR family transcriptional regulator [Neorhizobium petrolearium]
MTHTISFNPKLSQASSQVRAELVEQAFRVVSDTDFDHTVMKRLASAVSVSEAFIFRHFRTRIDLADALGQYVMRQLKSDLQALPSSGSSIGDLRLLFSELCERYLRSRRLTPGLLDAMIIAIEKNGRTAQAYLRFLEEKVAEIIARGQRAGEIRLTNNRQTAAVIFNSLMALSDPILFRRYGHALDCGLLSQQIDVVLQRLTKNEASSEGCRIAS